MRRALRRSVVGTLVLFSAFLVAGSVPLPLAPTGEHAAPRPRTTPAGIDVNAIVDTMRHRVTPSPDHSNTLIAHDNAYRAEFDDRGFAFATGHGASLSVSLVGEGPGRWTGAKNTAERVRGDGLTERVTARAGEIEWDLVLARRPARRDFRAEARLTGVTRVASAADSLLLSLAGEATVRMGRLVVRDARGRELYRALPEATTSRVALVVPGAVLDHAAYPVTIDPTVGPAHPVSTPVNAPAPGARDHSAVAFDGTNFLVVWQDMRGETIDIFGTRVSPEGAVLDPTGIPVSTAAGDQDAPSIAWSGTRFLVVWHEFRDNTLTNSIRGARVSSGGTVVDAAGIEISSGRSLLDPSVAWNGTNFLVAWHGYSGPDADITGARVSNGGTVLDPAGIPISTAIGDQANARVASDGAGYLVVWADLRSSTGDIFGTRVNGSGTVVDPAGIPVSTASGHQASPAVAWGGTSYLVVWTDFRSSTVDIFGTRVSPGGAVLHPAGIPISTAASLQDAATVAWSGVSFLVVWTDYRAGAYPDIYGTRVNASGTVLDPTGVAISTAPRGEYNPSVVWGGTSFLVAWQGAPLSAQWQQSVFGARVSAWGGVIDRAAIRLSTAAATQRTPDVVWDGTNFFVVWTEVRGATYDVYGARVSPQGMALDGAGIPIATGASVQRNPAVAWSGTHFFVVWDQNQDIFGTRVTRGGTVLDPGGIALDTTPASEEQYPDVAWNGTDFVVVWAHGVRYHGGVAGDVYGARVTPTGTVRDPGGFVVTNAAGQQNFPTVASSGTTSLVVWQSGQEDLTGGIFAARVSAGGTVLDPTGIAVSTSNQPFVPDVATNGSGFLVVWSDFRGGAGTDIYGARVTSAGSIVDPAGIAISTAPGDQTFPTVAWNGRYLVVWRDERSSPAVFGARVKGGVVQDPSGFRVSGANARDNALAAGTAADTFGLVHTYFVPEPPYGSRRVFLRAVSAE
jgi:hypothetical protein